MTADARLLPDGREASFGEITAALAWKPKPRGPASGSRALPATVVVFGPDDRLNEAAAALRTLAGHATVRGILLSPGRNRRPSPRMDGDLVALAGLEPAFVNNAVAALRLSSLPTIVWWRAGSSEQLDALVDLADRVVLDGEDPGIWEHAVTLFDHAAFSDLRWARLTRWRRLLAQFFELREVRVAASSFKRLQITGVDRSAAALFCAWLAAALGRPGEIVLDFVPSSGAAFIERLRFGDGEQEIELRLSPSGTCLLTSANVRGRPDPVGAVSIGDQSLAALLAEELRIRSRDRAFEAAVRAVLRRG